MPKAATSKILLHVVFFLSGIATVLIGQVLPILIRRFSLNDLEAGYFFPAQILAGSLTGTFLSGYFGGRNRHHVAVWLGCFSMALGLLATNSGDIWLCAVGFVFNGLGIGLTLPSINLLILEMAEGSSATALSILNFCWGAGAIICKPFVDLTSSSESFFVPAAVLSVILLACGIIAVAVPHRITRTENKLDGTSGIKIWSTTIAWVLAVFNFIHVGFESAMSGWLTTYSDRLDPASATRLLSPTLLFFACFVIGRAVLPSMFRFVSENVVLLVNLLIVLIGLVIGLTAIGIAQVAIGAAVSGLGTSTVFPLNLARFGRIFGPVATRRATPFFVAGTLGSALVSWFIGSVSKQIGSLRLSLYILVAGLLILIVIQVGLMLREAIKPEAKDSAT